VFVPSAWEGVGRARSCIRASGIVEVAGNETAKGKVEEEGDGREGEGGIQRASVIQELSCMPCACGVESESAAITQGPSWSVWFQEKGHQDTPGLGVGCKGPIMTRRGYAGRPVCLAQWQRPLGR
jgi:hypothetical protein